MKMRKVFGICCIVLGICCLISAVGFIVYNQREEENAQSASSDILQDVRDNMRQNDYKESSWDESAENPEEIPQEMLTTKVDGYDCIGVLSIPVLELELPVLTEWSYAKLKIAPCHYFGTCYEENFVIAAHN